MLPLFFSGNPGVLMFPSFLKTSVQMVFKIRVKKQSLLTAKRGASEDAIFAATSLLYQRMLFLCFRVSVRVKHEKFFNEGL